VIAFCICQNAFWVSVHFELSVEAGAIFWAQVLGHASARRHQGKARHDGNGQYTCSNYLAPRFICSSEDFHFDLHSTIDVNDVQHEIERLGVGSFKKYTAFAVYEIGKL